MNSQNNNEQVEANPSPVPESVSGWGNPGRTIDLNLLTARNVLLNANEKVPGRS